MPDPLSDRGQNERMRDDQSVAGIEDQLSELEMELRRFEHRYERRGGELKVLKDRSAGTGSDEEAQEISFLQGELDERDKDIQELEEQLRDAERLAPEDLDAYLTAHEIDVEQLLDRIIPSEYHEEIAAHIIFRQAALVASQTSGKRAEKEAAAKIEVFKVLDQGHRSLPSLTRAAELVLGLEDLDEEDSSEL